MPQPPLPIDPLIQSDPNRYLYLGAANVSILDASHPSTAGAGVIVRFPEAVTGSIELATQAQSILLTPLSPTLWVGILPEPESISTLDVKVLRAKTQFTKRYQRPAERQPGLEPLTDITLPAGPTEPIKSTHTFDVPYYPIKHDDQNAFSPWDWVKSVSTNITIRGLKTISLRNKSLRGTKDGFIPGFQRDELLRVTATGKVNDIEVSATIQDATTVLDATNPNTILLKQSDWELYFGEYWANLTQSELMAYNKRLDGVKGWVKYGPFQLTALVSESKGQPGFDQIDGTNSQGPYLLANRPVILYSEKVTYQGAVLVRDTDYAIDYELGQVRFLKAVISASELFTVNYEYSDSMFKRIFWAGRFSYRDPSPNDPLPFQVTTAGMSWQVLSENGGSTATINTQNLPKTHYLFGVDSGYTMGKWLVGQSELAGSWITQPTPSGPSANFGYAIKQDVGIQTETITLKTGVKTINDRFHPLGNASLQPSLVSYSGRLIYTPSSYLKTTLESGNDRYVKTGGEVSNWYLDYQTQLGPWAHTYYTRSNRDTSSTANRLERKIDRATSYFTGTFGSVTLRPGVSVESMSVATAPSSDYQARSLTLDGQYVVSDSFQVGSNIALQTRDEAGGVQRYRNQYGLSALAAAGSEFSIDGTASIIDDSKAGNSGLAMINYAIRPEKRVRFNGNYSLETLDEVIGTASYRIMNHVGNFQVSIRPNPGLTLGYKFKPTLSELLNPRLQLETRVINQYSVSSELSDFWRIGIDYKTADKTLLDRGQLPQAVVSQQAVDSTLLIQSDAQLDAVQTLRYMLDASRSDSHSRLAGTTGFEATLSDTVQQNLEYSHQLTSALRMMAAYRGTIAKTTQTMATDTHTLSHTIEGSSEWNPNPNANLKVTGSGTKTIDNMGILPETYLVSGRVDHRLRLSQDWTINSFLEASQSFSGQAVFRKRGSINLRYDAQAFSIVSLILSIQVDYESETAPMDYDTLDTLLKFTATF